MYINWPSNMEGITYVIYIHNICVMYQGHYSAAAYNKLRNKIRHYIYAKNIKQDIQSIQVQCNLIPKKSFPNLIQTQGPYKCMNGFCLHSIERVSNYTKEWRLEKDFFYMNRSRKFRRHNNLALQYQHYFEYQFNNNLKNPSRCQNISIVYCYN